MARPSEPAELVPPSFAGRTARSPKQEPTSQPDDEAPVPSHGSAPPDAVTVATAVRTASELTARVSAELAGKPEAVRLAIVALLARGHLLIEDLPGVGKTTLARALAGALDASFGRIQCTSDLLPSDMIGGTVLDPKRGEFHFRPGPIFHQVVLADEINRTTPKTQSALLEAMAEGQVSIDGATHPLPTPFFVVATQNPEDAYGTYPLPESQLDRFLLRMAIGYPDPDTERLLLSRQNAEPAPSAAIAHSEFDAAAPATFSPVPMRAVLHAQNAVRAVRVDPIVHDYLFSLVHHTRTHEVFSHGASPRAVLAFDRALRAHALVAGRGFAIVDDVKALAPALLSHRMGTKQSGSPLARQDAEQRIRALLDDIPVPI